MGIFNFFKKKELNLSTLLLKMYPKGDGKQVLYESFENVAAVMMQKMSNEEAFIFYLFCTMKFEYLPKNEKTINGIILIIQNNKPNFFDDIVADKIARQIYVDGMSRHFQMPIELMK